MSQIGPAEYLISLCTLAQESGESFGIAMRIGALTSQFNVEASKVIHSIVTFSPAPASVAIEFLNELEKVKGIAFLVVPVRSGVSELDCSTWATKVIDFLSENFTKDQRLQEIKPLTNLAAEMLTHLLIATRNPGGKKTPQDTAHPTPDIHRLRDIIQLLDEAVINRSQSALKQLLLWRDGYRCPYTGLSFDPADSHVVPRASHILPFSFRDKPLTLSALETFTGRMLADEVIKMINYPSNAFNAQSDAQESYDKLAWGIEAVEADGQVNIISEQGSRELTLSQWKYYYREIRRKDRSPTITLRDGQEIIFGLGDANGQTIDKPKPLYCNIKLAVARAMNACGAADIIAEMDWDHDDDEAIINQPVYLGGPFVPDDTLFRRLEDRLLS
ncbi:hypothetical protein M413DRAFT_288172 [Hebeloma cylindrosporum]|uniref:HNH nuclease domain-containing protein n=1 Tax=Hebeloma cylindrosporum TaxID=76867 RepID=A0A0C2Y644_HEBCY|nr:hypothetical protein M413DRAFT_288172 [Hebeloma cylindrosporum h7]